TVQPHAVYQAVRHRVTATDGLDRVAQPGLEVVALAAVRTLPEMPLDHRHLIRRQLPVEVRLQVALDPGAGIDAHAHGASAPARCASACLSARRPRCSRDITVPIGTPRMSAASW